jgi:hypothetical protein
LQRIRIRARGRAARNSADSASASAPHIELEEMDDGVWAIHFNTVLLATFDEHDYLIRC